MPGLDSHLPPATCLLLPLLQTFIQLDTWRPHCNMEFKLNVLQLTCRSFPWRRRPGEDSWQKRIGREREMAKGNRTWSWSGSGSGSGAEFGILLLPFHLPFGSRYPWQRVHCSLAIQCTNLILLTLDNHVHIRVHVPCPRPCPCPLASSRSWPGFRFSCSRTFYLVLLLVLVLDCGSALA